MKICSYIHVSFASINISLSHSPLLPILPFFPVLPFLLISHFSSLPAFLHPLTTTLTHPSHILSFSFPPLIHASYFSPLSHSSCYSCLPRHPLPTFLHSPYHRPHLPLTHLTILISSAHPCIVFLTHSHSSCHSCPSHTPHSSYTSSPSSPLPPHQYKPCATILSNVAFHF